MPINCATELHCSTQAITNFGVHIGEMGAENRNLSNARTGMESTKKAKINGMALFLDKLFSGSISTLMSTSRKMVYLEYRSQSSGELFQGTYDDDSKTISWQGSEPGRIRKLFPLLAYMLHPMSQYKETWKTFVGIRSNYITNRAVQQDDLFRICDDAYYEFISFNPNKSVESDVQLDLETIRQGFRTGQLVEHASFSGLSTPLPEAVQGIRGVKTAAEVNTSRISFSDCKDGAYRINRVWELGQETYIPSLNKLDNFVPLPSYYTMVNLIKSEMDKIQERENEGITGQDLIGENYINIILVGKPGTGKTTIAYALASTFGMPIRTVSISKNSEEDTYEGKTKTVEGKFNFVPTPFLEAYKYGGIIVAEEFNLSDPGVIMGAIGQAVEAPFILYEDGYKPVRRNPYTILISTMNTATQGSREPSEALTSRHPYVFVIDDPDENDFIQILIKKGYPARECQSVYKAYKAITNYLMSPVVNEEETAQSIGVRSCIGALKLMSIGCSLEEAVNNTMVGTIAIKNLLLARKVKTEVLESLPMAA